MVTLEKQRSLTLPGERARAASRPRVEPSRGPDRQSVELSKEYCERAEQFTRARVADMLRRFAAHHAVRRGVVDRSKWKLAKGGGRSNPVACYRRSNAKAERDPKLQAELLAIGAVVGSVEDLLHGVVNLSPEAMQIESAMTQRDLLDGRILGVVRAPSINAPFQSLSLKWALRNHEELTRHRDYVFLEATGLVDPSTLAALDFGPTDDGPGVVGYHLVHSLLVPGAPQMSADMQIIRGSVSYCFIFRQRGAHDVELYFRGYVHPQGGARDAKAFQLAAETVLATPHRVECGLMKKLAFSLRTRAPPGSNMSDPGSQSHKHGDRRGTRDASELSTDSGSMGHHFHRQMSHPQTHSNLCAVCRRSLRSLFGKKPPACELCDAFACGRCRVAKRVFVFQDGIFHPAKMEFCTECVVTTTKLSASWVAAQELALLAEDVDRFDDDVDMIDMVDSGHVEIDEEIQQRLTMSSDDFRSSIMGGSGPIGGGRSYGSAKLVWLPSDRVRPTITGFSPNDQDEEDDTYDVDAVMQRANRDHEGASGPPDGLFVPNEDDENEVIPMIDMPSGSEDEDDDVMVIGDEPTTKRFHRKDQPETDLSYLY